MAFDPDAFLQERAEADPLPAAPEEPAAPSYALPYGEADFKSKRARAAQFDPYIDLFAQDNPDLPDLADLTRAALLRESGGRTNAESSSGAVGLMQMLPSTYAEQGGTGDPFNAIANIDKGMSYLADQYRKFGSPELALAAYNAGPGSVRKHKGIPPFPETKAYVNAAMGYFQALRNGATEKEAKAAAPAGFDPDAFLASAAKQPEGWNGVPGMGNDPKNTAAVTRAAAGGDAPPAPAPQQPVASPPPMAMLPTDPGGGQPLMGNSKPKTDEVKALEQIGQNYLDEKKKVLGQHPLAMFTPEKAAATEGGKEDKRSFLGKTLGDILGSSRDVMTYASAPLAGKSYAQRMGERYTETASNLEQEPILKEAQRKLDAGEHLTPEEDAAMAAHPGFLKSMGQFIDQAVKDPIGTAKGFGVQAVEDLPALLLGQFGTEGALAVTAKLAQGWKAERSIAYAEKLAQKAAETKLAKPSVATELAKDAGVNAVQAPAVGYVEEKGRGGRYGGAEAMRDVATSLPFTFMGAPAKIIRSLKDPRPTLSDLRAHPAIGEMMPKLQHLLQNPETSDLGFLIKPKDDGTEFWSREDLDKAGYSDREPGEYGPAGAYDPNSKQVTLQKTADASTVMEESIHYLQDKIRTNSENSASSENPQSQFYTNLQKNIDEWESKVRDEAKRRGVSVPNGDELLGQAMTAHLGYADAYEGTVIPRIAVPDVILEGFNKLLGNADELRGAHPPGETDLAAASQLPEQPRPPEPVKPTTAEALDHAVSVEEERAAAGRASDERKGKMRREMIDLTPKEPAPEGTGDPYAGVEDMVVKPPAADEADTILAALQEHNQKASVDKTTGNAAPVDTAPVNQPITKGRKAKVRVPEEDLVISKAALEEKQARDQAFRAARGPQAAPDVPATPDLPARKPVPGTEGESNFKPIAAPDESPEVTRILNQSGRRPLDLQPKRADAPVDVLHVGQYTADALTRKVGNTPVLHVHPEDRARLGLYKGEALNPQPMNSMQMKRILGMPVKIDPAAPRLSEVAHTLHENLLERQQGNHIHIAGADRPDGTEFHADDLAEALKNRPRHKAALEKEIADAQGRYRSAEDRMLEEDQHAVAEMGKDAKPADKGYPADWDEAPKAGKDDPGEPILFQLKRPKHASEAGLPAGKEEDPKAIKAAAKAWKEKGTESPFFKRWFGDSKVKDASGRPIVVYHSSPDKFNIFDTSAEGAHFGTEEQASNLRKAGKRKPEAYLLSIKKPLRMSDIGVWSNFNNLHRTLSVDGHITPKQADAAWNAFMQSDEMGFESLKRALDSKGYDGIVYENEVEGRGDSYIAFHPEQIKSTTGNRGTFDPENPDIRYQLRARKPAEPAPAPEEPKKPKGETIPFPGRKQPAEGAFIPPAAGGMTREAGPAPRVNERVDHLRLAEAGGPPATLARDVARSWDSMDEDVRQLLMTHGFEHFEHIMKTRTLSDVEGQAFDAIVQGRRETMQEAQATFQQAAPKDKPAAEAEAIAAAGEYAAAQVMQINGLTETARALSAAARRMKGAKATDAPALVKALAKTLPDVGPQDLATLLHTWKTSPEQFADLLRSYANPGKMRKLGEFYRAGLLSWAPTHLRNVAGNVGESITRFAETPLAGGLDAVAQKLYGGDRTRFAPEVHAEVVGMAKAFPGALQNLTSGLKSLYRDEPMNLKEPLERQIGAIGSGKVGHVEKAVGRFYTRPIFKLLGIEDRFFRDIGGAADMHRLALRKALGEGKTGQAAGARADAILSEVATGKHPDILREVARLNDERVFQEDPGQFVRTLSAWTNKTPLGFFLPFVRTPANLANRMLQRTPFGFLKASREFRAWRQAVAGEAPSAEIAQHRGAAMDLGARALVGSTLLSGFAALAGSGLIGMTGGGPADSKEKNLKRESGWQPYSFYFTTGGEKHWVPYAWWEPVSSLLAMSADMGEANTPEGYDYADAVQRVGNDLISKTYLTSLIDIAEFVHGISKGEAGAAGTYASKFLGGWVPQFIGRAAQAADPVLRDTKPVKKGLPGVGERIEKTLKARIPGLSQDLPPVYSATGEPVQKPGSAAGRLLAPAVTSDETDSAPLIEGFEDAGTTPHPIPSTITVEGKGGKSVKITLTDDERAEVAAAQAKVSKMLTQRVKSPYWKSMTPEDRAAEIDQEYKDAHDDALDRVRSAAEKRARAL